MPDVPTDMDGVAEDDVAASGKSRRHTIQYRRHEDYTDMDDDGDGDDDDDSDGDNDSTAGVSSSDVESGDDDM